MRSLTARSPDAADAGGHTALESLCLVLSGDPNARTAAVAAWSDSDSRNAIVEVALHERMVPALYHAVRPLGDLTPKAERIPLAISFENNKRRNRAIADAVVELAAEAHRASIEMVALKGAMWVLEDPVDFAGWRPLGDADLLVEARHLESMRDVLARVGYRPARKEHDIFGRSRFAGHYHLVQYRRGDDAFVMEIHRDIGWRPVLLPSQSIFESRRPIAPGLSLPCPWHAALHCLIHWHMHHYGEVRGLGLNENLEIARFLGRNDVDWAALADHAAKVGILQQIQDAIAFAAERLRAPVPDALQSSTPKSRNPARSLITQESRLAILASKQRMRVLRLWDDHRLLYRLDLRGVNPSMRRFRLWAVRLRRMPFIITHLISIALLEAAERARARFTG